MESSGEIWDSGWYSMGTRVRNQVINAYGISAMYICVIYDLLV